ncbi:MAG TPA: aspartate carbamoyltransferase catalytic subunit [Synergistaceae bacterium]|nr:aspartate carbamoyltransferase catalytic subunit [Synergistaceae bacterium]HQF90663.1 aspartate carbamoyltransferase catalytic subunit [Synergistaceae bacterium]HQH77366.1 aspartate carbamoyltransferase catalytic subunit [Synergistaceae bacterium]HQK24237.1 aspartate carbamoyltransferase catalytic subunit [Synergistaceae bacterium]
MAWSHRNLLDVDVLTREDLETLLDQAMHMEDLMDRPVKKVPALRGKLVVNIFFEASTRTRVSFELAEKFLGADVVNWASSGSSVSKGETLRDTVWTLEAMGADAVVVRHSMPGVPWYLRDKLRRASVFNAGDGAHAHPTQALLDVYTAWRHLGSLEGKRIAIVGDILHSRVTRSDIIAFRTMGASLVCSGPRSLMPKDMGALGVEYEPDARRAVVGADAIYLLRIQMERQMAGLFPSEDEYHRLWGANEELVRRARPGALVMHPGPINRGVEIESRVADGPQSVILPQVKSGVATRMALLYLCMGGGEA